MEASYVFNNEKWINKMCLKHIEEFFSHKGIISTYINVMHQVNILRDQNHMIFSLNAENAFDKSNTH